jgi:hypothetical protein
VVIADRLPGQVILSGRRLSALHSVIAQTVEMTNRDYAVLRQVFVVSETWATGRSQKRRILGESVYSAYVEGQPGRGWDMTPARRFDVMPHGI